MSSSEHPDMSGNLCDEPFYCDQCGRDFPEEKLFGSELDEEKMFCSSDCVADWELVQRDRQFGVE